MYFDPALDCYIGLWNFGHCFGVKCLVVENLVCIATLFVFNLNNCYAQVM